ncbi:hypothetical protein TSTA_024570 [Talaromyces stipitatus ATCC 10500]|uniref:Uncharacterized protein n=1 Tax=Talaromyces stipitatus (strain ATCC 10500 / CBS 375.48 / QM 6759 / NRRL 1006) TaxID=441959 RepID=B8M4D8_TALSN|nr:uncharacterized protein TSTA_024570 [Talaromyces stipitatus ATCC 10500]EED19133.1 hypothetical protein TSTA_024570 [Talaromyces stipitatus ATCC 10500]
MYDWVLLGVWMVPMWHSLDEPAATFKQSLNELREPPSSVVSVVSVKFPMTPSEESVERIYEEVRPEASRHDDPSWIPPRTAVPSFLSKVSSSTKRLDPRHSYHRSNNL